MTSYKNYKRHCLIYYTLFTLPVFLTCMPMTLDHPALNIEIPSEWEDEAIVILSDSINLELKEEYGKNVLHEEETLWYKINKTIPDDLKTLYVYDWENIESKPLIDIYAIYEDSKYKNIIDITRKKETEKYKWYYARALWMHFTTQFESQADIPDYSKLKYLRVNIKRKHKRPEYILGFLMRSGYNTAYKKIEFKWPKSFEIKYEVANEENLFINKNLIDYELNANTLTLESKRLNKINYNTELKHPESWYAGLYLSLPPKGDTSYTWQQLGDYYIAQLNDSIEDKDMSVIDSLAESMQSAAGGFGSSLISKAFNLIKENIRYYGSWEKEYGWIPRDPKTILEKGYGDCKEMATLLTFLLRKLGIDASQTLVNTSGNFQYLKDYPVLSFNHMIVSVPSGNGQRLFLDPTDKLSTIETSYYDMIDQKVLILKEKASFTDVIKPTQNYQNRIITESTITPSSNGWLIKGKAQITGDLAYSIFKDIKRQENTDLNKLIRGWLKSTLKISPIDIKLQTNTPTEIIIAYSTDFSHCVLQSPAKGLVFTVPSVCTPNYEYCDLSDEGNRYMSKIDQTDRWIIPPEFNTFNFSNFEHQYGKGVWITSQNTVTRTYSCEFTHIDATERDKLKNFFNERSNFEQGIAWAK